MTLRYVSVALAVLILAGVLISTGCAQPDPPVMVTPFVAKAPQPPPAVEQAPAAAKLQPGTKAYEEAVMGK